MKRKIRFNMLPVPAMLFLLLLSSCSYRSVDVDMFVSITNGDINRQEQASAEELQDILIEHFGKIFITFSDDSFILPDNGKVAELSVFQARRDDWDCDDYAIAAMVPLRKYAFGAMYITTAGGDRHVINVFVNRNREIVYWEPQQYQYYRGSFHKPELIVF